MKPVTVEELPEEVGRLPAIQKWQLVKHVLDTTELNTYLDWPALAQLLRLERRWTALRTGQITTEIRCDSTNLVPDLADASRLSSQHSPRVFPVIRNAARSVLNLFHPGRWSAAGDCCSAQPLYVLGLLFRAVSDGFT